jgi:hypothetical protein
VRPSSPSANSSGHALAATPGLDGLPFRSLPTSAALHFGDSALFIEAQFAADAKFGEAVFDSEVSFARAEFRGLANFGGTAFVVGTFTAAHFFDRSWFVAAGFSDVGVFDDTTF